MKNTTLFILILFLFSGIYLNAQNEPHFTQQRSNEIMFNPGAIGNANKINATLLGRKQWYGFDGSPTTELFTIDTYLRKIYGGVGLSVYNDKIGYENTVNVRAMYAYPVQLNSQMLLTLGVGIGFISKSIQGSNLRYEDMSDDHGIYTDVNKFRPDFTFGGELNSSQGYTIGLSATHLDKSVKGSTTLDNPRHYYFYGKYVVEVDDNINIVPYLLTKSDLRSYQFELNTIGTFDRETWWAGLGYRYQDAISILLGVNIEKTGLIDQDLRIGYSYDFGVGGIRTYSSGSHEIMLVATFDGFNKERVKPRTPRLF